MRAGGRRILDVGCRILDVGYWLLDIGGGTLYLSVDRDATGHERRTQSVECVGRARACEGWLRASCRAAGYAKDEIRQSEGSRATVLVRRPSRKTLSTG